MLVVIAIVTIRCWDGIGTFARHIRGLIGKQVTATIAMGASIIAKGTEVGSPGIEVVGELLIVGSLNPHLVTAQLVLWV